MLDLIRKNGVDYVIVYHPSRISRNNEDMTNFMQVLDPKRHTGHGVIRRGVITDTGEYSATDPHGVVVFEGLLNAAKAENEHRSITAKKNEEFYKKRGIYPHRFPYGYESL